MKKLVFMVLLFSVFSTKAQVVTYKISKFCVKDYDKDLEVFNDWSEWQNTGKIDRISKEYVLSVSPYALKVQYTYSREPLYIAGDVYTTYETTVYKIIADEPNKDFSFNKRMSFNANKVIMRSNDFKEENRLGKGKVYAKTTMEQLLGGSFKGDIYFYIEEEKGHKGYIGYRIE